MNIIKEYKDYKELISLKKLGYIKDGLYGSHRGSFHAMYINKVRGDISFNLVENVEVFDENERGGVITLSTDVNAVIDNGVDLSNRIMAWLESGLNTIINRLYKNKKTFKYLKSLDIMKGKGFSVGNLLKGSYVAKDGKTYDESSFTITINGVNNEELNIIGVGLAELFNQESVLIHRFNDNETYLLFAKGYMKTERRNEKINDIID